MSILVITHRQKQRGMRLPYQVIVNGQLVGSMTTPQARLCLPAGTYAVTIRAGGFLPIGKKGKTIDLTVSSTATVETSDACYTCLDFRNKERWWDVLFSIDLVVWLASLLFCIPHPWNIVYHCLSDGFFLIWMVRLLVVRRRYYAMQTYFSTEPPEVEKTKAKE